MWNGRSLMMVLTHDPWVLRHGTRLGHASLMDAQVTTSSPSHFLHLLGPVWLEQSKCLASCEHECALLEEASSLYLLFSMDIRLGPV